MSPSLRAAAAAAWIGRITEAVADPASLAVLQERLSRHGAELSGQLPELLLRGHDPEQAIQRWLADKDLSHWQPQSHGGTAAQGWQFETAGWNRARGADAMRPDEIWRAHWDGSWDALLVDGVPQAIAIEGLEAAALAAGIRLGLWMLTHHRQWCSAGPQQRRQLLQEGLGAAGLSALSGAGLYRAEPSAGSLQAQPLLPRRPRQRAPMSPASPPACSASQRAAATAMAAAARSGRGGGSSMVRQG